MENLSEFNSLQVGLNVDSYLPVRLLWRCSSKKQKKKMKSTYQTSETLFMAFAQFAEKFW